MIKTFKIKIFIILFFVSSITLSTTFFVRNYLIEEINKYIDGKREDSVYFIIEEIEREYAKFENLEKIDIQRLSDLEAKLHIKLILLDNNERIIYSKSGDTKNIYFTEYPLFFKRNEIGVAKIGFYEEERIKLLILRSKEIMIFSVILSLFAIAILSILLSDKISKPLMEMAKSAIEISKGNLNIKLNTKSADEIGQLSSAFEEMIRKLKRLEDIRKQNIANISHEIRTPLTVLKGNLIAILDGIAKADKKNIESLLEEVEKLEKLTEGIKNLAEIDSSILKLNPEKINLKEVTERAMERLALLLAEKGLTIKSDLEDLIIMADKQLYLQLVINLMTNAIKASKEGDNIEVRLDNKKKELIVKDFGIGIDEKDINFIFERFYKRFKDGSGIGLSIVREIASAHGWQISVNSKRDTGTEFKIKFENS
ncbi:MAG: HAMP domain-containing histidine kinase [Proteobacteria bacterium]|nr:HAMP domain-containing histidine kinase [Pseudomonadota bacterium]